MMGGGGGGGGGEANLRMYEAAGAGHWSRGDRRRQQRGQRGQVGKGGQGAPQQGGGTPQQQGYTNTKHKGGLSQRYCWTPPPLLPLPGDGVTTNKGVIL